LIKINLVREGRTVRGAGAAPSSGTTSSSASANNFWIIGLLLAGLALGGGYWFVENRKIAEKDDLVASRKSEADKLDHIIKDVENYQKRKDSLQKRIDLINELKQNQKGPVRLMDQVSKDLPDLVWLEHMTLNGGQIALEGKALNPNAVANFVENIKADPLFEEPELSDVTQLGQFGDSVVYSWRMTFHFTYAPKTAGAAAGGTAATATGTTGSSTTSGSKP
jgi:type IV pilus assembly protein PilN